MITELYIDAQGFLFVIGYLGTSSTNLILKKMDAVQGNDLWSIQISGNNKLVELKDQFGYLFMTYRHKYVGGAQDYYYTSKINKSTGTEMWYSYEDMARLVSSGFCGHHEGANALEVDCNGDIYLTGYYDDANYGPGSWGIMKLNGGNGNKVFDLTISQDSLNCDNVSEGKNVTVVNGIPIFIGNEEVQPYETKATFVSINPSNGTPGIRHHIGAGFQQVSYTESIKQSKDTMFLLMQKGNRAGLSMRTNFGISNWEFIDSSMEKSKAGCISINDNSAFMAVTRIETQSTSPGNFSDANAIVLYKINKSTGAILTQDSLLITGNIELIEMESDDSGEAYLLFADGNNLNLLKWGTNGLLGPVILSPITENVLSSRPLDILINYSSSNLIFSGNQNLFSIAKSNLSSTSLYQYSSSRNVYGIMNKGGSVVLSGDNGLGSQFLMSLDTVSFALNWDQTTNQVFLQVPFMIRIQSIHMAKLMDKYKFKLFLLPLVLQVGNT